jgi:hypothetical protein
MRKYFMFNLQLFNEPAGGPTPPATPPGTPPAAPNPPATPPAAPPVEPTPPAAPFATFPDEASFMERMKREGKKQFGEFIKGLGFEKEDDLKAIISSHNENLEKNKTDLQKAQEAAANSQKERDSLSLQLNNTLRTTEAKLLAVELGVKPERVDYLMKLSNIDAVEVKDGIVDKAALKAALEKTLTDLPELKALPGSSSGGQNFQQPGTGGAQLLTMDVINNMSPAEYEKRRDEVMAFLNKGK